MPYTVTDAETATALDAARAAVRICRSVKGDGDDDGRLDKDDRSPVTVADFAAQAVVCRILSERFAGDPVIAEEESSLLSDPDKSDILDRVVAEVRKEIPDAGPQRIRSWIDKGIFAGDRSPERFWTLDPVDGTKGFLRGDQYTVALALVVGGAVVLGVMACPKLDLTGGSVKKGPGTLFGATRGGGAWSSPLSTFTPRPIRVSPETDPAKMRMVESVAHADHAAHEAIAKKLGFEEPPLRIDSQAKYGVLAAGNAELYLRVPGYRKPGYREKIWDHAAGALVIEEAGGRVTDVTGHPLDFTHGTRLRENRGIVASNGVPHDRAVEAVTEWLGAHAAQ